LGRRFSSRIRSKLFRTIKTTDGDWGEKNEVDEDGQVQFDDKDEDDNDDT